jgi:hypothetical protein
MVERQNGQVVRFVRQRTLTMLDLTLVQSREAPKEEAPSKPQDSEGTSRPAILLALSALGLVGVVTLFVAGYSGAFAHPVPRQIPVAVSGAGPLIRQLEASPALDIHRVRNPTDARQLLEARAVSGAVVLERGAHLVVDVASGGGHSVAVALTTVLGPLVREDRLHLSVKDLAPLSPTNPDGAVEYYCTVFLTLASSLGAMVLGRILGADRRNLRGVIRTVVVLVLYTAILAATFTAVADAGFGALTGHAFGLFLAFWAYAAAVSIAIAGVALCLGMPSALVVILAVVILGNTSAGGPVGRPLLSPFYSSLTPVLPQGAGLSIVRGVVYFDGRGIGEGYLALLMWGGAGLVLMVLAALRSRRSDVGSPPSEAIALDSPQNPLLWGTA